MAPSAADYRAISLPYTSVLRRSVQKRASDMSTAELNALQGLGQAARIAK
jgi:hypothetical protein